MANIIYRGTKPTNKNASDGSVNRPLTNPEIDGNFFTLDADKLDKVTNTAQSVVSNVTFSGNVIISGDLTVSGDTTTLNVATLDIEDKNIVLASGATTNDAANGGGITLKGESNKTITWDITNANWTSSEHWNIANGKSFKINNTSILDSTTLGSTVVSSSLTKLGTAVGFVKSDANGNLTSDNSTYSLSTHQTHYIGTTQVQASSVAQAVTGVSSLTNSAGNALTITTTDNGGNTGALSLITGNATSSNGNSGSISITSGNGHGSGDSGSISISTGSGGASANGNSGGITISTGVGTTGSGNLIIKTGDADAVGGISITPGICDYPIESGAGTITIRAGQSTANNVTAGHVYVAGGNNSNASNGTGGNVYIDGGSGPTNSGVVIIGSSNSLAVDIGSSSNTTNIKGTVKLPNVGVSGFVKLGAGGQLTADTNTYLTGIADGAVTTAKIADGAATIAKGGVGFTTYTAGDIIYSNAANSLAKLTKGSDGQVLKLVSGFPAWAADNDTTYTAGTGLTLTGTSFSVSYGTTATTACVGNDARLSDARTPLAHNQDASTINSGTLAFARLPSIYVGTTAIQSSSANQNLTGINSILLSGADSYISTPTSSEFSGYGITIQPGSAPNDGAELNLYGGNVTVDNGTGGWVGVAGGRAMASNGGTAGGVAIVGGYANGTSGTKTGGSVYIDGGGASGAGTNNQGNIFIGTRNETQYNTGIITIGRSGNTIRLPAVGTSGFVKLGANGTLSADTNTYLTSYTETDTLTSVTGRGATTNVNITYANNANANFDSITGPLNSATTYTASRILFNGFGVTDATGEYYSILSQTTGNALAAIRMGHASRTGRIEFGNMAYWTGATQSYGNGTYPIVMRAASSNGASAILEVTSGEIRSPIYYEYGNTAYYLDLGATGTSLNTAGSIIAGGNLTANSDRRLKTDIRVIENALDKVHKITGVTFDRTDNPDVGRQTGVIAQEVKEVLPEAVIGNEESYYSVAYGNMVGLLIEAIKELNAKVEDLQKQLSNK